jgi:Fe-S cluster assembly protein SufD
MEIKRLLKAINADATAALQKLVFPHTKQEDWRYTDISPLQTIPWQIAQSVPTIDVSLLPEAQYQLVFHNNVFQPDRSIVSHKDLLVLGTVGEGNDGGSHLIAAHLGQHTDPQDVLSQINSQFCQDLSFIYVPPNYGERAVIALHYGNQGQHWVTHPRSLIVLAPHTQLTIVEMHQGNGEEYWSNPVTEIYLGEHAQLTHVLWQEQGTAAFHTKTTRVIQAKNSFYHLQTIDLGARLSRHNLHIAPQGDSTSTTVQGLVLIRGHQLADTHSTIVHSYPEGRSNQLHKCILREHSHGVFNGRIWVTKTGQLTDARQLSRNLLLSPHARIDTKPQLEIVADNVKCSHGATVSQLDREEAFYLQSRGIDLATAQQMLIYAFAAEIIKDIPLPSLRERIRGYLHDRQKAGYVK